MSRYIDADEVIEQIRKKLGVKSLDYLLEAERQIVAVIQSMPSIDIVRCKECKWCLVEEGGCERIGMVLFADEIENHFCGYGEREGE